MGQELAQERIIEELLDFGLATDEAEAYLLLLRAGPCSASVVSRKLGVNRMKAYRTLKALEEKGAVQQIIGRPVRYVANPLEAALERHIEEAKVKVSELEKSKNEIMEHWKKSFIGVEALAEEPRFRIFQGRQQVYDLLLQMCQRAKEEIRLITTINDLFRMSFAGIEDELKDLDYDQVKKRLLTQVGQHGLEAVEDYMGFAEVRHITLPSAMRFVIIDESEVLTTFAMDDSMSMSTQGDTGLWTNASNYVKAMKAFFDAQWRTAPDAREVVDAVRTGRAPHELRIIGTREEYSGTYKAMVESSNEEVIIMNNHLEEIPITVQDLQAISERGVKTRLLTQVDLEGLPEIDQIYRSVQVRHKDSATDLRILIVDGREVLLQIPYFEGMRQAVWFNLKTYVDTMVQVFNSYWIDSVPAREILPKLVNQKTLTECLELAKKSLEGTGWIVRVPGKLTGESGLEHSFSLVANHPDQPSKRLSVDMLTEEKPLGRILTLSAKVMDAKPAAQLLAATRPLDKEDRRLAELYGITLIYASETQRLVAKIMDEANRILRE